MSDKEARAMVRVRFAPSPTGYPHLGNIRAALFNWLYARKTGGTFILRIEDTDKERSKKEYEDQILDSLTWLGLDWDEGVTKEKDARYRQSERAHAYKRYLEELLAEKKAYWCYCSKEELDAERALAEAEKRPVKYSGRCRDLKEPPALPGGESKKPQVIRLRVPEVTIEFEDMIRGHVVTDMGLSGDIIIAKNLEEPLYNFAVVVDDEEMDITHVLRGEDHISNTPKQIIIQKALGFSSPIYGHLPLILNADRSKLSKRYADVNVISYREQGYLPQALDNYLALLGWHPTDDREVFTLAELIDVFDLSRVQKGGAIWDGEKLRWLNREHMKRLSDTELAALVKPRLTGKAAEADAAFLEKVVAATRDRMETLADFDAYAKFFFELPEYAAALLVWKKGTKEEAAAILPKLKSAFSEADSFDSSAIEKTIEPFAAEHGKGSVFWPLRVALSGQAASPDPVAIASALGKDESLRRIEVAERKLNS